MLLNLVINFVFLKPLLKIFEHFLSSQHAKFYNIIAVGGTLRFSLIAIYSFLRESLTDRDALHEGEVF